VQLDGKDLLDCPGTQAKKLKAGRHQVVGQKPGFETESRAIELRAGKKTTLVLELKVVGTKGHLERRMNKWVPWTVVGIGAAALAVSVPFYVSADNQRTQWDEQFLDDCSAGCKLQDLTAEQRSDLDAIDTKRDRAARLFYASVAVGAVGVTAGVVLVLVNQPRLVGGAALKPEVGSDHASLSIVGRW
jgi:hypothetical protein